MAGVQLILENGGCCYLPERMARHLVKSELLHLVPYSPRFQLPAYVVYARRPESPVVNQVLDMLRELSANENRGIDN